MTPKFSHLTLTGNLYMVDITQKSNTEREAVAKAEIIFPQETYSEIISQKVPKGDLFTCAKLAGILACKKTHELIPLCHPLPLTHIDINFDFIPEKLAIEITGKVKTISQTGVEMEALTAVSVAALTIYDMCKSLNKNIKISNIRLIYKTGGKSGEVILEDKNL